MKKYFAILSLLFVSVAHSEDAPKDSISYFYGTVTYTSADGKISFGESYSLVKRIVSPATDSIIESAIQPSAKKSGLAEEYITTLTRQGYSNSFIARDAGHTFTGFILFLGEEWNWSQWKYSINLVKGGKITGEGVLSPEKGIVTDKLLINLEKQPSMRIHEELEPISEERYREIYNMLQPSTLKNSKKSASSPIHYSHP